MRCSLRVMSRSALLAALVCLTTLVVKMPLGIGGAYVHAGDAFVYLAACLLPAPYAMAAGALGAGLADLLGGYAIYALPSAVIKCLLVLPFVRHGRLVCARNVLALFVSAMIGLAGYFVVDWVLYGSVQTAVATLVGGIAQPVVSAMVFLALGYALDRVEFKKKFGWEIR